MRTVPGYASHLRVYEPLGAFPPEERRRWEVYVAAGEPLDQRDGVVAERRAALVAAIGLPVAQPSVEHAFVHRDGGGVYVCPWRTRMRSYEAIREFRASMPAPIADAFVPRAAAEAAERELERWRSDAPELARSYIRTAAWQVPLRWFVPFEAADRRLELRGARSLTYLARMAEARRRVARAVTVLRATVEDGDVVDGADEVGRWLSGFHPAALVELDYGGLAELFDDVELEADESAADVAYAVDRLAHGDPDEALAAYRRVSARWGAVRAVEVAN